MSRIHRAARIPVDESTADRGRLAFDRKNNKALSNLYLRMIHPMGIDAKSFGASTGALTELG